MSNQLKVIVEMVDRITKPFKKISGTMKRFGQQSGITASLKNVNARFRAVGTEVGKLTRRLTRLGLVGAAVTFLFKRQLVDTAAEFERFRAILETVEGSSIKASRSMQWVSDFAARTPFELEQVMQSFVKLRAFGLEPTNGLLRTLGDTAAAMGKPLNQAVEAIADAVTGENERLKEFGIKARTVGKKVVFEYTANGKTLRKVAQVGNRELIQSTLEAIWNEKYAGAMKKQSTTWLGMLSNISDQWARFKLLIMNSGVFEWLKDKLAAILERINQMAASGELQRLAEDIGRNLVQALKMAWQAGRALWRVLRAIGTVVRWVADLVGGFGNLAILLSGIIVGKLIVSLVALGTALKALFVLLATNPITAAITLLVVAAALIIKNWAPIKDFFIRLWDDITHVFKQAVLKINSFLPEWVKKYTPGGRLINAAASRFDAPVANTGGFSRSKVDGTIKIEVDGNAGARVRSIERENRDIDFEVDAGPAMVMP